MSHLNKKKIINDPIYGFISLHHDLIFDCIQLPEFQRLRRIKQLGLTSLVYPGAQHTRFQHVIGAMHLMYTAVKSLRAKDIAISEDEEIGVLLAILLHDIGHGPFSHSLEHSILTNVHHEDISSELMHRINRKMDGKLDLAIHIFEDKYHRPFLHQLVSSQLDMDRLDYLRRDSFYTGVSEGTVGIERIIQMLNVKDEQLIVDQKGIYSVEKFLMARRFMYWQVYLHKTSIAADGILLNALKRAKELIAQGKDLYASPFLHFFLRQNFTKDDLSKDEVIYNFCALDDNEIMSALKVWMTCDDVILSKLCQMLVNRNLPKIEIADTPYDEAYVNTQKAHLATHFSLSLEETAYFVTTGQLSNKAYSSDGNALKIGMKNGSLKELSETSEIYNLTNDQKPQIKYFITYVK
ncbi:HD domain-containing protein [Bacteroidia bacterium]|nr:HD domain-containing protein [Bacteroidota bacterium]MDA9110791.1 HD domain-containing protein [Bacteroidia bacterium]